MAYNISHGQLASIIGGIHEMFVAEGCASYVKTIYVSYDIGGDMVAALYGHGDHVEVALAVSELNTSPILVDASHLTWRTLPLSAIVKTKEDLKDIEVLIADACERVRQGQHDVKRDNEYFMKSRRERRGR